MKNFSMSDLQDQLEVMCLQEQCDEYRRSNYIGDRIPPNSSCEGDRKGDDLMFRESMAMWCYRVVDHYNIDRENVIVAFLNFDRFVSVKDAEADNGVWATASWSYKQLALATALYMSIKVRERGQLTTRDFANFSQGLFTANDVELMERKMLSVLSFRITPPTAIGFAQTLLPLCFPLTDGHLIQRALLKASRFLSEMIVSDPCFISKNSSSVALACILNAIEDTDISIIPSKCRARFIENISSLTQLRPFSIEVIQIRARLEKFCLTKSDCKRYSVSFFISTDEELERGVIPDCFQDKHAAPCQVSPMSVTQSNQATRHSYIA